MHADWRIASQIYHRLRFPKFQVILVLSSYYLFTIIGAAIEGMSLAALALTFTQGGLANSQMPDFILRLMILTGVNAQPSSFIGFLLVAFLVLLLIRYSLLATDGMLSAVVRRRLQVAIFESLLNGDWSQMRNIRVGDAVGAATQEALIVTKYLLSILSAVYFVLTSVVMSGIALAVDWKAALSIGVVALPLMALMRLVFALQARLSRESAEMRTRFSGDISERLSGLLQVRVDGNAQYHLNEGIAAQPRMTHLDILIGLCQALIGSFNVIFPLTALSIAWLWIELTHQDIGPMLASLAAVGIIGLRVSGHVNNAVASLGNLSRLSGSLHPVYDALTVLPEPKRAAIPEPTVGVKIKNVEYTYSNHKTLQHVELNATIGIPIVIRGRSGRGKTTLTNLIAGIYQPSSGVIQYIGASGSTYDSCCFRAKIGYVTQDVHLFQGTMRDNLLAGRPATDDHIWTVLDRVDAANFVRELGGLDASISEAGRSLSGGQRRRLGIARVLLAGSEILILDEISSGLDTINREKVIRLVEELAVEHTVFIVAHEEIPLASFRDYLLN